MSDSDAHPHGAPCWFELVSSQPTAASEFYRQLFGWRCVEQQLPEHGAYTLLQLGDDNVAGMYLLDEELSEEGVPSHWVVHFAVDDIDAAVARAVAEGGELLVEPFELPGMAFGALLVDPEGAGFCLWQAAGHNGADVIGVPGAVGFVELATRDAHDAGDYYHQVLGWSLRHQPMSETGAYSAFGSDEEDWGGMLTMDENWGDTPAHWALYFAVEDADAIAREATQLGGTVLVEPFDVQGIGRMAHLADPSGASFHILQQD